MVMRSADIIHHMACDISQCISDIVPEWPFPNEPGDSYTDAVCLIFGKSPTKESVIRDFRKKKSAKLLQKKLNEDAESDIVTIEQAESIIERLVLNNFGADATK